jgi:hypothetical protein
MDTIVTIKHVLNAGCLIPVTADFRELCDLLAEELRDLLEAHPAFTDKEAYRQASPWAAVHTAEAALKMYRSEAIKEILSHVSADQCHPSS